MSFSEKEIRESKQNLQKRQYKSHKKSSWKRLKITNEDGWTAAMRKLYFDLNKNAYELILKNDMTDIKNRPKDTTKKDIRKENGYAEGIWSDEKVDATLKRMDELIRFSIKQNKEKKESGFFESTKAKPIKRLKDINQHHVKEYVQAKLDGGIQYSSVRKYVEDLHKGFESTSKGGIKSHKSIMNKCSGRGEIAKSVPERTKAAAVRNVGKTDGEKGYSLEQARKIIEETKHDPLIHLAANVFTYMGSRYKAISDMKWSDVIDEKGEIREEMEWFTPGMLKGGRQQIAEVNDARESLENIYKNGGFYPSDSIFGNVSRYKMDKAFKGACERAGVDWKGYHGFRSSTVEYYETEKMPGMLDGKSRPQQKEVLAKETLKFVNIEVPHPKTGELYKPHNPQVKKKEPVKVPKTDSAGDIIRDKKGNPVMVTKMNIGKNGNKYPVMRTVTDEKGQPVMVDKYNLDDMLTWRIDKLKSVYVAEQISHNRPDANRPYRNYKNKK